MRKPSAPERLAVCETEISHIKTAVDRVCISDIPNIYAKLESLNNFSIETRSFFKLVEANTETLKAFNTILFDVKNNVQLIRNQEALGKKEKASIVIALIASISGIAVAFLT